MNQPGLAHRLSLRLISPLGIASRGIAKRLWRRLRPFKTQISSPVLKTLPDAPEYQCASSPSYRGVPYNRISTLMDVDYFRGSMDPGGKNFGILRVLNPDPSSKASSVDVRVKPICIAPRLPIGAGPPRLPVLSFMVNPEPPLSSMIATALEELRSCPHTSWRTEEEDMNPSSPPTSETDSSSDGPSQPPTKHTIARKPLPCPKDNPFPPSITSKCDWNMARLGCHRRTRSTPSTTETISAKDAHHSIQTTECEFTSVSSDKSRSSCGAKSWTSQEVDRNKQSHIAAYLATLDYSEYQRGVAPSIHSFSTRVSSGILSVSGVSRGSWRNNSVASGPDELSFVAIAGLVAQHRRGLGGVSQRDDYR
ncbi:uncharacterized protein PFLUO_LOCUS5707 [Penicillium psychrofluorescens]|uniref:uncharacterized protein n=1 Tax=Penicillium psychrofluorescens TaxID=3158075 RepID=UPI003CCDCB37